ncbi:hypothetical protein CYMTET_28236 [Cymbomonas tetramitiformis]|uniref:Uncharacterized protein n=1 Tax=Cymbomonas tetramitiformis TaxID=36881 RepID=A0AAE0KW52_9CHLO|nr:hypothetical protein CYMTET_28236 [Cymbomonas tetramitiformis]
MEVRDTYKKGTIYAPKTLHYLLDARYSTRRVDGDQVLGNHEAYFSNSVSGTFWRSLLVNGYNVTLDWSSIPSNQWIHVHFDTPELFSGLGREVAITWSVWEVRLDLAGSGHPGESAFPLERVGGLTGLGQEVRIPPGASGCILELA